jgi:TonB-linked SusC/RagA family outer membrane protein
MKTMVYPALALVVFLGVCRKAYTQYDFDIATNSMDTFKHAFKEKTKMLLVFDFDMKSWQQYINPMRVSLSNASYETILTTTLQNQPFNWKLENKMIHILPKNIEGPLLDEKKEPVRYMTIRMEGSKTFAESDSNGHFSIASKMAELTLIIGNRHYEEQRIQVKGRPPLTISLKPKATLMDEAIHDAETGYQGIPRNRATGSFDHVDKFRFQNNVAGNPLMRLPWLAPGLLFSHDRSSKNMLPITIRGLSTLFLNSDPIVIIDNWPWEGDIRELRLNPNTIEKITILKDAAATAIWGVRAGNGVIMITTKRGSKTQNDGLEFISNLTFVNKPDLFYQPVLHPKDFIDFEIFLFNNGFFDTRKNTKSLLSPVVEILLLQQKGLISAADAKGRIDALKMVDNRYDIGKNFYRIGINQQHALNFSGSSNKHAYFFSVSRDQDQANIVNSGSASTSLFSKYQLNPTKKLRINMGIQYTQSQTKNNEMPPLIKWGYVDPVDDAGNALTAPSDLRQSYKDTIGRGSLQDWNYRPFDELRMRQNIIKTEYLRLEGAIQYRLFRRFTTKFLFLYVKGITEGRNYMSPQMYYTRHLINSFSEISSSGITRHIPLGGILDKFDIRTLTRNHRFQLDYDTSWNHHHITAIMGIEQRYTETKNTTDRQYGYDPVLQTGRSVDYEKSFPVIYSTSLRRNIPFNSYNAFTKDYYLSGFMNTIYTFKNKYSVSGSVRIDKSNIFGSETNTQWSPLWSVGASWLISGENFYHLDSLSYLKLRGSFGYSGSPIKTVPSEGIISSGGTNMYNVPVNTINLAPNKNLRPEKVEMFNIGLDFDSKNKKFEGSIEYYWKRAFDLLGKSDLDYTTGVLSFSGNVGEMKAKGAELKFNYKDSFGIVAFTSSLLFSYNKTIVTKYPDTPDATWKYIHPDYQVPMQGKPPAAALGFAWMGLNGMTGDPVGLLNGQLSQSYDKLLTLTPAGDLVFKGSLDPVYYGSLYNQISAFGMYAAFNVVWKGGHYLIANTVDFTNMANGLDLGHKDYLYSWQKPDDEATTQVPSINYTDPLRDMFNSSASIRIKKADFIQLQQLEIGYEATPKVLAKMPFSAVRIYVQASNLGILYQSAPRDINPDYNTANPVPRQYTIGLRVSIK